MHTVKVKFKILKNGKREKQIDLIYSMLGSWRMNGQILGKHFPVVSKLEYFVSYLNTPEKQSLSKKYNNKYGAKQYSNLLGSGLAKPQIKVLAHLRSFFDSKSLILSNPSFFRLKNPLKSMVFFYSL